MPTDLRPLLNFLDHSPTPFHAVANVAARLRDAGFTRVDEADDWHANSGKYFFTRNDSALVALNFNQPPQAGLRVVGAHTDSPCLKIKPNALVANHGCAKLGVEVYGGALLTPWFDRDLGMAGRVVINHGGQKNVLLDTARPIATIPNLAIHLNRNANKNRTVNPQLELSAILGCGDAKSFDLRQILCTELTRQHADLTGLAAADILAFELALYDCQKAQIVGLKNEFIASARLDNLLSCYAGCEALIAAGECANRHNYVLVLNDHEEVGSVSSSGADGAFLESILLRACGDAANMARAVGRSMLVSADNAHAVHPNYPDRHDPNHLPQINAGPVVKINANQHYATNAETEAVFRRICAQQKINCQTIAMRTDMACGSTIGPITAARLGMRTIDIGVAQLAMHSIRELAGTADQKLLIDALRGFYEFDEWPF